MILCLELVSMEIRIGLMENSEIRNVSIMLNLAIELVLFDVFNLALIQWKIARLENGSLFY